MTASELLDQVIKTITDLGQNPLVSDTIKAYKGAEQLIKTELESAYEKGCSDTSEKMARFQVEKQKKEN